MFRVEQRLSTACGRLSKCRGKHQLAGDDYQFLQRSVIPSYHFQKSLRRLPVPKLTDSCNRFLASAKVVLNDAVYKRTEEVVRAFEKSEGPELQKALLDYDRNHKDTSYICEPWFDMYLRSRIPCPVNFNPFMMYAPDPNARFNHQIQPRQKNTSIGHDANVERNLCGARHLRMTKAYVRRLCCRFLLRYRLLTASSPAFNVMFLTSLDRDTWAKVRDEMMMEAGNAQNFEKVDGALFTLCLDDLKSQDPIRLTQSLLIGDDASNRWFDKSFSLIMDGNGQATINFEHSWGDGVAVLRLMEESYKDTNTHHFVTPDTVPQPADPSMVKEIEFNLTDSLRSRISEAQKAHVTRNSSLDFATMEYCDMTKDTIKKSKMSPDSIMQLAIQMAFYSIYKEMVPTYESCSTAAFLKGRTDCMRYSDLTG
ncbi:Choline/Carnitine O-acyltransferase [Cooperia oncophora]